MSNVKEVHCKPSLHVPVNLLFGGWPPSYATPPSSSRRAYAPTSNTASHDNHEKINLWVSSWFPLVSYMGMGLRYQGVRI